VPYLLLVLHGRQNLQYFEETPRSKSEVREASISGRLLPFVYWNSEHIGFLPPAGRFALKGVRIYPGMPFGFPLEQRSAASEYPRFAARANIRRL